MKKLILIGSSVLMLSIASIAQTSTPTPKSAQERTEKATEKWTKELGLSAEQVEKVKVILMEKNETVDAVKTKKASGVDKKEYKGDRKEAMDKRDEQMKAVLTPEQYTKYLSVREQMKTKRVEKKAIK